MSQIHSADLLDFEEYTGAQLDLGTPPSVDPPPEQPPDNKNHNFWTIEYYQKYFDVNTDDVLQRISSSIIPKRASISYFDQVIRTKPDLYGPFWISTTLIFTIAISGNIASYLQNSTPSFIWKYDFHLVSYAATAIMCYTWIVPILLWGILKWTSNESSLEAVDEDNKSSPSMISLFCIYGYSLFIFIPVSILLMIQVFWLQWLIVTMAALLSGLVLIYILLPALRKSKYFVIVSVCILAFHFLLAAGFMLYFFHSSAHGAIVPTVVPSVAPVNLTVNNTIVASHKS